MRVLQVTAAYKPAYIYGGPTMSVAELCEQLTVAGIQVDVFTTTANGTKELDVATGQPVIIDGVNVTYFRRLTKDHSHFSPALLKAIWQQVRKFDVVHIHAWWNLVSVLSCIIALWRGVPVVVSPRGTLSTYSFKHKNSTIKRFMHAVLSRIALNKSYIHATSAQEAKELLTLINPLSISVIPNFVKFAPVSEFLPEPRTSSVLKLLFFSRIDAKKGLELLFDALKQVQSPYTLTIAGTGEESYIARLKQLAEGYAISEHITWLGFQHQHKFELLAGHDALVLTSFNENFANVVIESLSTGTAVIISNHVGLADYVQEKDLGWICDLNPTQIASAINYAASESCKLNRIRTHAPGIIRHDFSAPELSGRYLRFYQKVQLNASIPDSAKFL